MNKFKLLVSSLIAMLAFAIFAVTGIKVNAATVTRTYDFYNNNLKGTADTTLVANEENEDFECASSEDSTEKMTLNIDNVSNGTFRWKNSDAYVEFQCKNNSAATLTYTFTTKGDATLVSKINTGGGTKYVKYSIDNGTKTQFASGTTGGTEFSFEFVGSGEHTLVFSDALGSSGSNMKIYSLTITDVYDTASAEDQAVAAISAIGTVEYTTTCKNLIDIATTRVNAVAEAKRNATYISNYETYTSAVSTFNSLKATAISNFITAVNDIGTVTASSGTAISTAQTYYGVLFGDALTNEDVVDAKATLDEKYDSYNDIIYDTYSKTATFSGLTSGDYTNNFVIPNTIYSGLCSSGKKFTVDNSRASGDYTGAIKTNGASTFTFGSEARVIKFKTKKAGTLTVVAQAGDTKDTRKAAVYTVGASSNTKLDDVTTTTTTTSYTFNITGAGEYLLGAEGDGIWFYYISFEEKQLPTATFGTAVGTDNDGNTAIAFIVKLENVEDVTLLDAMAFTVNATFNQKVGNAKNYAVTTCYEALTAFGDANTNAAVDGTYYVYFTVYGITSSYSGMELDVTFNATYGGSAITANTTYTYTA